MPKRVPGRRPGFDFQSHGADVDFEYPPCVDLSLIKNAKLVFFNGNQVAPDMPPPEVHVSQTINNGSCSGKDAGKYGVVTLNGIFACCEPEEKIAARESLLALFAKDCGTLEVDQNIFENVRVRQVSVGSSNYLDNVPYSVTLDWIDENYGSAFLVQNISSVVSAQEDDDKVSITHTVSAQASNSGDCEDCTCDMTEPTKWVLGEISDAPPVPATISIPKNPLSETLNCPNIEESIDLASCTHTLSKTWVLYKNIVTEDDWDDNKSVTSTYVKTISEDRNQRETINHSGTLTYNMSPSCENPHDPKYMEVLEDILKTVFEKYDAFSSKVDERNITKSESPPSISWSITFLPDPIEDERGKTIDEYCMSAAMSRDGVTTITLSGNLRANENYPFATVSRNCKCEAVEEAWDPAKYFPIASEYYQRFKGHFGQDIMKKLMGPCFEQSELNPNLENENVREGKEDCSKNYSFTWTDKKEMDREWNYTVDITDPIEKVNITPLLNIDSGYRFCVVKSNEFSEGRVTINGQRTQDCPDDPIWDKDAVAKTLAQNALPGYDLFEVDDHCNTETIYAFGKEHPSRFSKTFKFEHASACQSGKVKPTEFDRVGSIFAVSRNQEVGTTQITKESHSKNKKKLK